MVQRIPIECGANVAPNITNSLGLFDLRTERRRQVALASSMTLPSLGSESIGTFSASPLSLQTF